MLLYSENKNSRDSFNIKHTVNGSSKRIQSEKESRGVVQRGLIVL
ncbi:hypothetical protein D2M30_3581 [Bacillus amyloliquefaciens]|nr:hypothetical protein D2M30_3581 [Bacillus amyloliquefaciens]